MNKFDRTYWYIGDKNVFRISKDRCQRLMHALLICNGKIHDTHSTSIDRKNKKIYDGIKIGSVDAVFCVSIKTGTEDLFRDIMGDPNCLEEPIKVHVN